MKLFALYQSMNEKAASSQYKKARIPFRYKHQCKKYFFIAIRTIYENQTYICTVHFPVTYIKKTCTGMRTFHIYWNCKIKWYSDSFCIYAPVHPTASIHANIFSSHFTRWMVCYFILPLLSTFDMYLSSIFVVVECASCPDSIQNRQNIC